MIIHASKGVLKRNLLINNHYCAFKERRDGCSVCDKPLQTVSLLSKRAVVHLVGSERRTASIVYFRCFITLLLLVQDRPVSYMYCAKNAPDGKKTIYSLCKRWNGRVKMHETAECTES